MAEKAEKKLTIFGFLKNTYDMGFDLFMSMLPKPMQDWIKSFLKASKSGEKWMGVLFGTIDQARKDAKKNEQRRHAKERLETKKKDPKRQEAISKLMETRKQPEGVRRVQRRQIIKDYRQNTR